MDPTTAAVLSSWTLDGWLVVPMLLTAAIYLRGWLLLRRRGARQFDPARLSCFLAALVTIYLALGSPVEAFAPLLLVAHMVQHLVLVFVAAPLVWLAAPQLPLLVGLPAAVREVWVEPVLRLAWLRAGFGRLTRPAAAWTLHVAALWAWHIPQLYEMALASAAWHYVQHACFFGTALLFWWPLVQPYPSRPAWSRWHLLPYLFLAGVQGTVLSAILTFSDRVLYPHYHRVPRLWGLSALDDQAIAGAVMWIPGSLAYLIPLALIGNALLYGQRRFATYKPEVRAREFSDSALPALLTPSLAVLTPSLAVLTPSLALRASVRATGSVRGRRFDLLAVPLLSRFLRWRHARWTLRVPLLVVAAAVIVDGLTGPQVSPLNLAGVLPWIHWRGVLVLALLAAGNVFCTACPFTAPRGIARRLLGGDRAWPRSLRSKWPAVALLVAFFWAYEAFALWNSPWWTAWIAVGYFAAAFVVEGLFRGAAFCKYVCPIGQFNFVQSLVSPWEVGVRQPHVCQGCATKDCIRGHSAPSPLAGDAASNPSPLVGDAASNPSPPAGEGRVRGAWTTLMHEGCGLDLFQPLKSGNMDCTFCLDCVRACPHDNVGVLAVAPGRVLLHDRLRSGIGRLSQRPDLAALVVLLVFAAFVNAAGMVGPVLDAEARIAAALGLATRLLVVTAGMILGLVVAPAVLVAGAAVCSRWLTGGAVEWRVAAMRFVYSMVPLGCGMWLAHYGFHLFTSADSVWPAVCRAAGDMGFGGGPSAAPASCCTAKAADWLLRVEIMILDLGLLGSLYLAHRTALDLCGASGRALRGLFPWAVLIVLLFAAGIWIVFQPMDMRGTMGVEM